MRAKELRRILRYQAAKALPGVLSRMPASWAGKTGAMIGACAYWSISRDRRLAHDNLRRVFPQKPPGAIRAAARWSLMELGKNAVDFVRYPSLSTEERRRLVGIRGMETLEALREGAALVVTGHLGCWELIGAALAAQGYPVKGLARPLREKRLDHLLRSHRRAMGFDTIDTDSPRSALKHLNSGGWLAILIDQRVPRGLTVPFLGQDTVMTDAPARLSLASGAPLAPMTIHRCSKGHEIHVGDPLLPPARRDQVPAVTRRLAAVLSERILHHPREWMWIHPRWQGAAAAEAKGDVPVPGAA